MEAEQVAYADALSERATEAIGLTRFEAYMADLEEEILERRAALIGAVVTEIAVRRGQGVRAARRLAPRHRTRPPALVDIRASRHIESAAGGHSKWVLAAKTEDASRGILAERCFPPAIKSPSMTRLTMIAIPSW
jgi:kynureninase